MIDLRDPRLRNRLRGLLPEQAVASLRRWRDGRTRARRLALPRLSLERLRRILQDDLGVRQGSTVFIHSSLRELAAAAPAEEILELLLDVIGKTGTIATPTYPKLVSYEFLRRAEVFDLRNSASFTGRFTEILRCHPDARRSLHPTKSVAAIGLACDDLLGRHHLSPYAFSSVSPYGRLPALGAVVIGLGVSTKNLSFVHAIEDALGDQFPVATYIDELFHAPCIDAAGTPVTVPSYGHDLAKMVGTYRIPQFLKGSVASDAAQDLIIDGRPFFRVDAALLFKKMTELSRRGITWYPREFYRTA